MEFELYRSGTAADIIIEDTAFSGVCRIAEKVCEDIRLVTGVCPHLYRRTSDGTAARKPGSHLVIAGTLGKSALLVQLEEQGLLDLDEIRGKREVFSFSVIRGEIFGAQSVLVIAGSDKRGTIYGLFHISELLGVSPFVHYSDVQPQHLEQAIFTENVNMVSREPSVRYRGFFINDEWPAFGNWTMEHFGGFNAKMYDIIFELLLRLKGNYLWPAMWTSCFSLDGPGLASAELADEYGVVMCNSHHEPCLRHSEEWDKVRGRDTIYGDEWNYSTNKQGLLNYWRDGLKRSGRFENVITIGMRGERDSIVQGADGLKQNIDMLKDIITEQRKLISEYVDTEDEKAPMMLALYKEVEPYFYGDETTEGLRDWEGLDGVTCMLCEDNHGNMRTLPTKEYQNRSGGWGMYYHFDYHGGPVSFEWVNSSFLPKVWEQMTTAYETGIRDIWVVNVGDVKFQEFPLNFFMDLAYDYDTYGQSAVNQTQDYTRSWIRCQFPGCFCEAQEQELNEILTGYTRLNHMRRPEALNEYVYHPVHFGEADQIYRQSTEIVRKAEELLEVLRESNGVTQERIASYIQLVYYPAVASMNVLQLQINAGWNQYYAKLGAVIANRLARQMTENIQRDRELTKEFNGLLDGKWKHLADSEHIGFIHWNDEECRYPLRMLVEPANKPRLIAMSYGEDAHTSGGGWTGQRIHMRQFMEAGVDEGILQLLNAGQIPAVYHVECDVPGIHFSRQEGSVDDEQQIMVHIDKKLIGQNSPCFYVQYQGGRICVQIDLDYAELPEAGPMTFLEKAGYISIEAAHFYSKKDSAQGGYQELTGYGKTLSGMMLLPTTWDGRKQLQETEDDRQTEEEISLTYQVWVKEQGEYELQIYGAPVNPREMYGMVNVGVRVNQEKERVLHVIDDAHYMAGENSCPQWCQKVLDQIQITKTKVSLNAGVNQITLIAIDPGLVPEKLVLVRSGVQLPESYLGPAETFYMGK